MKKIFFLFMLIKKISAVFITIEDTQITCKKIEDKKWLYYVELINHKKNSLERKIDFKNIDLRNYHELKFSILSLKNNSSNIQTISFLHEHSKNMCKVDSKKHFFLRMPVILESYEKQSPIFLNQDNCLTPIPS